MVGLVVVVVERNSFFRSAVALTSLSFALASFGWLAGTDATASKLVSKTRKSRGVGGGGVLVWFGGVGLGVQATTALLVQRERSAR